MRRVDFSTVIGIIIKNCRENMHIKKNREWIYNKKVDKYDIIEDRKRRNKKCLQKPPNTPDRKSVV